MIFEDIQSWSQFRHGDSEYLSLRESETFSLPPSFKNFWTKQFIQNHPSLDNGHHIKTGFSDTQIKNLEIFCIYVNSDYILLIQTE